MDDSFDRQMGFWKGFGVFLTWITVTLALAVPLFIAARGSRYQTVAFAAAGLAATLLTIASCKRGPVSEFAPFRRIPGSILLSIVPIGVGWVALEFALLYWFMITFPAIWKKFETSSFAKNDYPLVLFIAVAVVVPFYEELLFRGLILSRMRLKYSDTKALVCSGSLFALAHLNPIQMIPTFLAGVCTGWLRIRTGSLLPAILLHALNNGIAVSAAVMQRGSPPDQRLPLWMPLTSAFAGLLLIGFGVHCLRAALSQFPMPLDAPCPDATREPQESFPSGVQALLHPLP